MCGEEARAISERSRVIKKETKKLQAGKTAFGRVD